MSFKPPVFEDIEAAAARLEGVVVRTPLLRSDALDAAVGARVFVKPECLQTAGSFKIRGAYNRIVQLTKAERRAGVVAFSSGNHAQGVADAANRVGVSAAIVMPSDAPAVKVRGVQARGAEIIFYDRDTESREEIAQDLATSRGAVLVPSYDDACIIAGQGSVGLEAVQDAAHLGVEFDAVHCCVGGGGLISGVALAFEVLSPQTQIWGAEPDAHDDTARSLTAGKILSNAPGTRSFCDALLSPSPGEMTFAINQRLLDGVGCVSDADVRAAMRFAFEHLKLVVEPGGAAALAFVLAGRGPVKTGSNILVVLTGGNVDPDLFADVLRRSD